MSSRTQIVLTLLIALVTASIARLIPPTEKENSSSEESTELNEVLDEIRTACEKNSGSNKAFDELIAEASSVPFCFMEKFDVEGFSTDVDSVSNATRKEFFTKYCPQLHDSLTCFNPTIDKFRACMDKDDSEGLDVFVNLLPEAIDLICRDDGEIFFVDDQNIIQCIEKVGNYSTECLQKVSNATDTMSLSNYGAKQCGELSDMRQCFEERFTECKAPRLLDVFDLFYRAVVKSSACKNFIALNDIAPNEGNEV
ncbi:27 kDa hemolymph glycoprotein-like [Malaya genurostris]|uniref:27 kDa hemolymph glycoprotein-like n=1 Tax=Malaya genurostris TaxID=325434 RepID=UPI0026F3BE6C|nr:27 kDa hemolymph glycoprotein-like [Malaya genurostris]